MRERMDGSLAFARRSWPGQLPEVVIAAKPYEEATFSLEGHELRIVEQGRSDAVDTTSLYVPAIDLVVAGDILYNECHMFVADTTPDSRVESLAALDRLAALNPRMAVAGHKKPGAPDTPAAVEATKRYLTDFGLLKESAGTDEMLFDQMTELYPGWVSHQAWLMFGLNFTSAVRE
jgi:hypothetical protein